MKIKRIICIAAALLIAGASGVYAAEKDYIRSTGKVVVSGDGLDFGETVRMIVLKPDADYEKLISGETTFFESCIHIAELTQKFDDGKYEFKEFTIKEGTPSGEYTIVVVTDDAIEQIPLDYASVSQVLEFITNSADAEEVQSYIDKYNEEVYKLPIEEGGEYYKLDEEGQNYVLSGLISVNYENSEELISKFSEKTQEYLELYEKRAFEEVSNCSTAAQVKEAIDKYEKVYGINREDELFKELDSASQTAVYSKMTEETYTDEESIQKAFKQKIILQYIKLGPYGKISGYISSYNDILGLDLSKYSASNVSLLKYIVGKDCKTTEDLQKLIDGYKASVGGGASGSGGGSAGSSDSGISATGSIVSVPSSENNAEIEKVSPFSDVSVNHWAFECINGLFEKKIINGKTSDIFEPDAFVTRAEAVKMIVASIGQNLTVLDSEPVFTDVAKDSWEYEYVKAANNMQIISGYEDGSFGVNDNITRQDLCVIIYRTMRKSGYESKGSVADFTDSSLISDYATEAVGELGAEGVISGMGDGSFNPQGYATRAQIAKIIYGIIK